MSDTTKNSGVFEQHGIEPIPAHDRNASLSDFLRIAWGGSNSLATAVLGAFPIILGLSFWQAVAATVLGVTLGALLLAPMSVFGATTGTNNAVASSAHFGVVGRLVGSFLSLLTAVSFFSISVWSSGDAVVGAANRLFGWPERDLLFALCYGLFAAAVLVISITGYRIMLWVSKVSVVAATALFGLGFVTYWPQFDAGFAGSGMAWGDHRFWPAFLGAALIVLANPISFGAFLGDWSRYLPARVNKRHLLGVTFLSQILSLLPFLFGLISTSIIARAAPGFLEQADYTGGLLHIAPGAFVLPLFALAILSGLSTGVTSLYGTGLDFSSVIPGLSRAKATLCIGVVSIALIFIGRFAFNLVDSLTTFVSLIVVLTTPWMIIMMIGYQLRRGHYLSDALQVFNRGEEGGAYWFMGGWNVPGMGAWAASGVLALSMVNIPGHFVGWLGSLAGNYDLSLPTAIILPALLYPALMHLIPDPIEVYGSDGAWGVPMAQRPGTPITRRASVAL